MPTTPRPRRETVTGVPRGSRASQGARGSRTPGHAPARSEISEQTTLGATYVRSLMRSQLRTALLGLGALAPLIGTLPLLFLLPRVLTGAALPASGPFVWAALGLVAYPVMWLIARWYVHRAERNERDFRGLLEGR
ncbi:hypothetical protein [Streptomyces candidus]|uniref:DUF485 domain-containing protein n=1 Tax=Streptomyces candidus TaxID=67283 RepID=A0A7X0LSQ6_9ACTN|nr:hypothetical protein [Streptomyces candidus]MBB6438719.1 hypothetical protein [Streptomyces candidus]GHH53246.1 hypothetical protein GCM10018773_54540 [Streptomyces candidus]